MTFSQLIIELAEANARGEKNSPILHDALADVGIDLLTVEEQWSTDGDSKTISSSHLLSSAHIPGMPVDCPILVAILGRQRCREITKENTAKRNI